MSFNGCTPGHRAQSDGRGLQAASHPNVPSMTSHIVS